MAISPYSPSRVILIIDDDYHMLLGLRAFMERNGYKVLTCENSLSSVKMAEENRPDLIICDVMMPLMDGFKVREELAVNPVTSGIPFIFLSARAAQNDKLLGLEVGADEYVTKPFDPQELLARIKAVFRRQRRDQQNIDLEIKHQIERIQEVISHNVSSEFHPAIRQILTALDMVLRNKYDNPDNLKEFIETALSQSHRLNGLIDDLTFLNDHDTRRTFFLRQKVDIDNDFAAVVNIRQEMYRIKNLRVEVDIAEGIVIHAPRREFRQMVSHLVDNALKFSFPFTSVLIDLAINGNGGCVLTITDYGVGIPSNLREKVFERYYQITQGNLGSYGGLGVGLTIFSHNCPNVRRRHNLPPA